MIVKQFDGIIDFESQFGKGSNFYFTFKLDDFMIKHPGIVEDKKEDGEEA